MGSLFSKRPPPTTLEILEQLEKEIDDLESNKTDTEFSRRRAVGYIILLSIILFLTALFYWYFYIILPGQGEFSWRPILIWLPTLLIYPLTVYFLKWSLCWWYDQTVDFGEQKLQRLRKRKREILDRVKDKETYKVAKEILGRYDEQTRNEKAMKKALQQQQQMLLRRFTSLNTVGNYPTVRPTVDPGMTPVPRRVSDAAAVDESAENARENYTPPPPPIPPPPSASAGQQYGHMQQVISLTSQQQPRPVQRLQMSTSTGNVHQMGQFAQPRGMIYGMVPVVKSARPALPRDRSTMDKLVDYILGEGPTNKYALICRNCHSHNGMALKEELEQFAFRCCYCCTFNPPANLAEHTEDLPRSSADEVPEHFQAATEGPVVVSPMKTAAPSSSMFNVSAIDKESASRPASRASIASHCSTQSAPPTFKKPIQETTSRSSTPVMEKSDAGSSGNMEELLGTHNVPAMEDDPQICGPDIDQTIRENEGGELLNEVFCEDATAKGGHF